MIFVEVYGIYSSAILGGNSGGISRGTAEMNSEEIFSKISGGFSNIRFLKKLPGELLNKPVVDFLKPISRGFAKSKVYSNVGINALKIVLRNSWINFYKIS